MAQLKVNVNMDVNIRRDDQVRVYLGCGEVWKKGWINVDVVPPRSFQADERTTFVCGEALSLGQMFPPESVDVICAEMLLEHIPQSQIPDFLYQCWQTLKPEGELRILTVNFNAIAQSFCEMNEKGFNRTEFEQMSHILMNSFPGMQLPDCHKSLICEDYLNEILPSEGFTDVKLGYCGTKGWGLTCRATRGVHVDRISLKRDLF